MPFHYEVARLCVTCQGKGGADCKKCAVCKGNGGVVKLVQMGPGMYAQQEEPCGNC